MDKRILELLPEKYDECVKLNAMHFNYGYNQAIDDVISALSKLELAVVPSELVNKLNSIKVKCGDTGSFYPACMSCIADFIIEDRKRIVKPLLTAVKRSHCSWDRMNMAIEKTLKNAGIEQ